MLDKCYFSGCNFVTKAGRNMTGQSNWVLQLEKQNHLALLAMRNAPEKTWQHAKEGVTNTKQTSEGRKSCCFDLVHGIDPGGISNHTGA